MKKKATPRGVSKTREEEPTVAPIRGYAQRKLAEMHGTKPNIEFDEIASGFDAGIEAMKREASAARPVIPQPRAGRRHQPELMSKVVTGAEFIERQAASAAPTRQMRSLGRVRSRKVDAAIEAYGEFLAVRRCAGDVLWFRAQPIELRLADETYYGPNFAVMVASGHLEMHHVVDAAKNESLTTVKIAAEQFPFRFVVVHRGDSHDWKFEEC